MNELAQLLSDDEWPRPGTPSRDVGWYEIAPLSLRSGELWVGDPEFSWAELNEGEGITVALEPGDYIDRAYVVAFGNGNFVSRLRICRNNVHEPVRGAELAQAGTDSASIGVCDAGEVLAAFRSRFKDDINAAARFLEDFDYARVGLLHPRGNAGAAVIYLKGGLGDGGGPFYELLDGDRRVGIELPFIPSGTTA